MNLSKFFSFALIFGSISMTSCAQLGKTVSNFNLFPVTDDVKLGKQVSDEIDNNKTEYPVLPRQGNEAAYAYLNKMRDKILENGNLKYRNVFSWEIKIIKKDDVLNAFCTPGGHIYVYTGLIKYLDSEDQLAGVLGHEMAHADLRHSTRQMTKMYGLDVVSQIILGDKKNIAQITNGLIGLKFSRNHETEADEYSVRYLCGTDYNAAGAAGFFMKMQNAQQPPAFLSTHPNPKNRVQEITKNKSKLNCAGTKTYDSEYAKFKALLGGSSSTGKGK